MERYAANKSRQKGELGFGPGAGAQLDGAVATGTVEDLVDGLLGLKPIALTSLDVKEERFGIRLPHPDFAHGLAGGTAIFTPQPSSTCVLAIGGQGGENPVEIDCNAIFPPVSGIPVKYFKARLTSKYLDAVFNVESIAFKTAEVWADIDHPHPITDWITYFRIISELEKPDCTLALRSAGRPAILGTAKLGPDHIPGQAAGLLRVLRAYEAIREAAGCKSDLVSLRAIHDNYTDVMKVAGIVRGSRISTNLTFETASVDVEDESETGLLVVSRLSVGEDHFAYAMSCGVVARHDDGRTAWTQNSPMKFLDLQVIAGTEAELVRYQKRLMRVSGARLSICEGTDVPIFDS